jgi:hypothetical protein
MSRLFTATDPTFTIASLIPSLSYRGPDIGSSAILLYRHNGRRHGQCGGSESNYRRNIQSNHLPSTC